MDCGALPSDAFWKSTRSFSICEECWWITMPLPYLPVRLKLDLGVSCPDEFEERRGFERVWRYRTISWALQNQRDLFYLIELVYDNRLGDLRPSRELLVLGSSMMILSIDPLLKTGSSTKLFPGASMSSSVALSSDNEVFERQLLSIVRAFFRFNEIENAGSSIRMDRCYFLPIGMVRNGNLECTSASNCWDVVQRKPHHRPMRFGSIRLAIRAVWNDQVWNETIFALLIFHQISKQMN